MNKISLIGAGNIGGTLALLLTSLNNIEEIVLYDIVEGLPQGKALDLNHSASLLNFNTRIKGTNQLSDIAESALCIVTAGVPRKPGMSRDDLLKINAEIIVSTAEAVTKYAPECVVIVVTNPLDAMAWLFLKRSGFEKNRVVGMAGILDSARYAFHLGEASSLAPSQFNALVLGGHGDDMVTVRSFTNVSGIPVEKLIDGDTLLKIENRVRNAGGEVVGLLKTGSAFVSPAAGCFVMAKGILADEKKIFACSCYLQGEYGLSDICMGVPCILGRGGVEKILELNLNPSEQEQFVASSNRVKDLISRLKSAYNL